ncbi:MAG: outer membrane protein assembly factor BamE [Arenicellales bacterium]|nr:outer membrane protein assembly factor BamE [Arenicellales bacterium]
MSTVRILTLAALILTQSACIKTHRIDIQQGNVITDSDIARLVPGMTKREVRYILGTPLVVDPFHQNQWDYFYSLEVRGKETVQRRITIVFENEKMKEILGDVPTNTEAADEEELGGTIVKESQREDKGFFAKTWDKIWNKDDKTY